MTKQTNFLWVL